MKRAATIFCSFFSVLGIVALFCFFFIFLVGGIRILINGTLYNLEGKYRGQVIDTISIFLPAIFCYMLLIVFDHLLVKKRNIHDFLLTIQNLYSTFKRNLLWGTFYFLIAILVSFIILGTYYYLIRRLGWTQVNLSFDGNKSIFDALLSCAFISLREEFLFRLLVMSVLAYGLSLFVKKELAIWLSLFFTSLIFSLSHFFVIQDHVFTWYLYFEGFTGGFILGLAHILTKSLGYSLGYHLGWDFFLGVIPAFLNFTITTSPYWAPLLRILLIILFSAPIFFLVHRLNKQITHWLW
jgi:membrane protease YdiL (CAAX protease family)